MTAAAPGRLAAGALFRYGLMAVPLAFAGLPIYLHAPDFYARELAVPLFALGMVLLVLRIVDAAQDPLIGWASDRLNDHRQAILLVGVVLLAVGFWMIFHPLPDLALAWFGLAVFLCTAGWSVVSINFQALGGLWHAAEHERTRITGWREGLGLVGLLLAAVAPAVFGSVDDPARAFHRLTLAYLPLLAVSTWLLLGWLRQAQLDRPDADTGRIPWRQVLASSWRRNFFGIVFVNGFASAIPAVLVIFFIRDRLDAEAQTGTFLLLYFLSGAAAMPLWQRVAARVGKPRAWAASMVVAILTFAWAFLLGPGDLVGFAIVCVLSGLALGADLSLPPSILADHIAEERTQASAASLFSVMTLLTKSALALATGLILPALGLAGYQPGTVLDPQAAGYLNYAYALLPCAVKAVALGWLAIRVPARKPVESAARPDSRLC